MFEYFSVGYVLKPRGLKGEIKVEPLTDDIRRFDLLDKVYLKKALGYQEVKILKKTYIKNFLFIILEGYDSIEKAQCLRNQYLWIPRTLAVELPKGNFFISDIIDCVVETVDGIKIGRIKDVIQTGHNDVYVVDNSKGEVLIPALKKVVKKVDLKERILIVDANELEGLLPDDY